MIRKIFFTFILGAILATDVMAEIKPAVNVCNKMNMSVWLAKGRQPLNAAEAKTEGWYEIKAGTCLEPQFEGLAVGDVIYLYARYDAADGILNEFTGDTKLCIDGNNAFAFENAGSRTCDKPGNVQGKFRRFSIPTDGKVRVNLTEAAFVKKPSLVQVCNKLNLPVWLARGFQVSNIAEPVIRGWFELKSAQCTNLYWGDSSIGSNAYLFAEYTGVDNLKNELSGDTLLCVQGSKAFTYDNAASRGCDEEGNVFKKFRHYLLPADGKVNIALTEADFIKKPALLRVCNKLKVPIWSVKGYQSRNYTGPTTAGWYQIKDGECLGLSWDDAAIGDSVYFYSYYQATDGSKLETTGDVSLCINGTNEFFMDNAGARICDGPVNVLKKFRHYTIPQDGKVDIELKDTDFGVLK